MKVKDTKSEFEAVLRGCRRMFADKLADYGASWRILRPESLTDQLMIKAMRIRTLQREGEAMVDEGITPEFVAIVNYGIVGMIQLAEGCADTVDLDADRALALYDAYAEETKQLMLAKNHDYGEAWRFMRVSTYTDLILTKLYRTKQIEDNNGQTRVSEGIDANYKDMVNYSVFALIKLGYGN